MKTFIFDISWDYCGGMAVAIAASYERACELIQNYLNLPSGVTRFEFVKDSPPQKKYDYITFLKEVAAASESEEWVFADYNYA